MGSHVYTQILTKAEREQATLIALRLADAADRAHGGDESRAHVVTDIAAELVLLRAVVRQARRLAYVRNAPPVRAVLDRLPKGV
jgi:hypothetical protein